MFCADSLRSDSPFAVVKLAPLFRRRVNMLVRIGENW
jgi:hypothetical protein